jgi:REP element-mobilizing transposase RayT
MSGGVYSKLTGYHNRRSIRLPGYDYSRPGYYFVTMCIHNRRRNLFGNVVGGEMVLSEFGKFTRQCWYDIPKHFPDVKIDDFIVMPNHVHGIIRICGNPVGANNYSPLPIREQTPSASATTYEPDGYLYTHTKQKHPCGTSKTVGSIVRGFKIGVSKMFHRNSPAKNIWQRGYYDHIIRDEKSLFFIREYIRSNPMNWCVDSENHVDREIREYPILS